MANRGRVGPARPVERSGSVGDDQARGEPVVAIDGPAGSGKSTVAALLARRLGYLYIDTGAMYRGVALAAARRGVSLEDGEALARLASSLRLELRPRGESLDLLVDGEDVSDAIRAPEVSRGASRVSRWPGVREALVAEQQRLGAGGGVVMEGRDIGTVVFPGARAKFFITASLDERARRRAQDLASSGQPADLDEVRREVQERDRRDAAREHSPLRRAEDAEEVLTDGLTVEEVVDRLEARVRELAAA